MAPCAFTVGVQVTQCPRRKHIQATFQQFLPKVAMQGAWVSLRELQGRELLSASVPRP